MTVLAAIGASILKQDYFPVSTKKQQPIALFENQFTAIYSRHFHTNIYDEKKLYNFVL